MVIPDYLTDGKSDLSVFDDPMPFTERYPSKTYLSRMSRYARHGPTASLYCLAIACAICPK